MDGVFLSGALALGLAALSAGMLYLAAPRQQLIRQSLRVPLATGIALPLLAVAMWLMSRGIGAAPGVFAVLAAWMLALVAAPWAAHWFTRRRAADGA
ncbi:hypothetical protein [Herbaspirillum chlorophenolicum]|jgi:hypothetical protein|uniref:hypothetical protein n=1 Tax=Herbaspirillum chlorophenolicum TaxID=211589 RepID=UPI00067AF9BB|nr:hypothetical protein [Herbaspirillum chlorophenolicum]